MRTYLLKRLKMVPIFKKTFTLLIRIFCIAMFAFQFYLLTRNYLQFNVRKDVKNYIENTIELPEIRILIPYQFAFDLKFLKTKYASGFEKACAYFSEKKNCERYKINASLFSKLLGPSLLLSDIAKYSHKPERIISGITMSLRDPDQIEKCKMRREVSVSYLIIVLSCLDSSGLPMKLSRSQNVVYNMRFLFGFETNISTVAFTLTYPGKVGIDDVGHYTFATLTHGQRTNHAIRFSKHTVKLLPPPYNTMCKNYNQGQVFAQCLNNKSLEQTGLLYPETSVDLEEYSKWPGLRFNSLLAVDNGTLLKINEMCKSFISQPMCNSVQYAFRTEATSQDVPKGKETQLFYLIVSTECDSLTESKPNFPLVDYLILSGSLFGTWFGVSIMGQLLAASNLCCLFIQGQNTVDVENPNVESETRADSLP